MINSILNRKLGFCSTAAIAVLCASATVSVEASAQTTPGAPVAEKVPLDVIASLPTMSDLRLSPDGTRALATLGADNSFVYAIVNLEQGGAPTVFATADTLKDGGDRQLASYRWATDRYVLLTLQSRENIFGQRADLYRLAAYDTKTKKTTPLAWDGATADASDVLHIDEERGRILLARMVNDGNTERMFKYQVDWVDLETGRVVGSAQGTNPIVDSWFADGNGVVRMAFGSDRDSGRETYLYRSNDDENFRTVQKVVDKDFVGAGIRPIVFLPEPDMAIVSSNHSGYRAIYKANLATMEIGEKLFSIEGYDVGSAIPNDDANGVLGFTYATDRAHRKWTHPTFAEVAKVLEDEFGAGNARLIDSDKAYQKFLVALARPNQMDSYYLYDTQTGQMRLVAHESSVIRDGLMNPVEAISYKASDGVEIEAVVTSPRLRAGQKNLPVVVLAHGGPYGVRDYASYDQWAQAIAEQGYVVVQPNYRGSGGYGTEFVKAGRSDGFGTRMQDDLNDVVDHLAAQGIVDKSRACMMGWSYGGYASARAAQRDPSRWRCAIAGAGVYDLPRMRSYDAGYLGSFGANYLAKGANSLADVSPARNADGRWSPILIVHGLRDPRVPIEQARVLRSALRSADKIEGTDFAYLEQPKNGHYGIYFTKEERLEWLGGASAWLAKHNPAYVESDPDFGEALPVDPSARDMATKLGMGSL